MLQTNIPVITKEQMKEVDRLMFSSYGITLIQMMENAGRNLAIHTKKQLGVITDKTNICVVVGSGNNGGGGLVAARFLSNWGANVSVLVTNSVSKFKDIPRHQFEIINQLPVSVVFAGKNCHHMHWDKFDLVIDAVIGYGLNGKPTGIIAETIHKIDFLDCPVISLDMPSGLDSNKGYISDTVVRANSTLTLALPKTGLLYEDSLDFVGDLYIADISVPPMLYRQLGLEVPIIFSQKSIVLYKSRKKRPSESILL